jgi:hypothetical protein
MKPLVPYGIPDCSYIRKQTGSSLNDKYKAKRYILLRNLYDPVCWAVVIVKQPSDRVEV